MGGRVGDARSETVSHLEEALERSEDTDVRYHIRQAIQILYEETDTTADA